MLQAAGAPGSPGRSCFHLQDAVHALYGISDRALLEFFVAFVKLSRSKPALDACRAGAVLFHRSLNFGLLLFSLDCGQLLPNLAPNHHCGEGTGLETEA